MSKNPQAYKPPVGSFGSGKKQAPKGYVAGIGRGAAGFTTRSDLGPMGASSVGTEAANDLSGSGSRSSELREAKLRMKAAGASPFGVAPAGYVAGMGRGAGMASGGDFDSGEGPSGMGGNESYDQFSGYDQQRLFQDTPYDQDDEEADAIYASIDARRQQQPSQKKRKTAGDMAIDQDQGTAGSSMMTDISSQFRELKQQLKNVTHEQWMAIPEVGDHSLRHKNKMARIKLNPMVVTDTLLADRLKANRDATAGGDVNVAGNTSIPDDDGTQTTTPTLQSIAGLSTARGAVLNMSLDKYTASSDGTATVLDGTFTSIDPKGYLTSLSSVKVATSAEIGDINKARLLLKSVRDTNPHHGPGWIASARVEEAANNVLQARKLIQQACKECPGSEDVWLEAARLHPPAQAKTILATAVRKMLPKASVKIYLKAADLEQAQSSKKAVLRKALEAVPTSVTLWKAAIDLEDDVEDAKILLGVAVEKVPTSVELWLALARLETYENARKVLNQARKKLPMERCIWIAAAKLEESQNQPSTVISNIISKAVQSLMIKHEAAISREQWLAEAEATERANAPLTSAAIIQHTIGLNVEELDRQRTWSDDARRCLENKSVKTARAILSHALQAYPTKKRLWTQAVELERKHGTSTSLDEVLDAACQRLPNEELFWLVRAKEQWTSSSVDKARDILRQAFQNNPDSEEIWLAAAKLEWETGELERARVLLKRARDRASTPRIYMKSALLERQTGEYTKALELIDAGLARYPNSFPKLYMMGGQICSDDLMMDYNMMDIMNVGAAAEEKKFETSSKQGDNEKWRDKARSYYQRGIQNCPKCVVLWILTSRLEERIAKQAGLEGTLYTKARSLLELARLKNPKNDQLWVEAVRLERRAGNEVQANTLLSKALQESPQSGLLLAETILTAPKAERKGKSALAIQRCPEDPLVILAVARIFSSEAKQHPKARKWFERAITLNADLGDSWAYYYAFELEFAPTEETKIAIKERCIKAEPSHGELWCQLTKQMPHRNKSIAEKLEIVATHIMHTKHSSHGDAV